MPLAGIVREISVLVWEQILERVYTMQRMLAVRRATIEVFIGPSYVNVCAPSQRPHLAVTLDNLHKSATRQRADATRRQCPGFVFILLLGHCLRRAAP
ncbi:hypothetical protein BIW11_11943 [Tropilaelaps mercedesae]|uniref:Uncharacterized protein n=1 Tax=Tropilaelaps mercedesae TaxID=418985 RepID=A0A1V9X8V8_9ACAR|nr:hypothetical protein BIW11_11943 [Tropilaelaps mercedesae]